MSLASVGVAKNIKTVMGSLINEAIVLERIIVPVVIGVVWNANKKVLIAKRPPHATYPGYWEFPGGKIEENETQEEALARELYEEVGIIVTASSFLLETSYDYEERTLHLFVYEVEAFSGDAFGAEQQEIRWVEVQSCVDYQFPPANTHILKRLLHE
jgi:8-oxo-dGTP diphosphatase